MSLPPFNDAVPMSWPTCPTTEVDAATGGSQRSSEVVGANVPATNAEIAERLAKYMAAGNSVDIICQLMGHKVVGVEDED